MRIYLVLFLSMVSIQCTSIINFIILLHINFYVYVQFIGGYTATMLFAFLPFMVQYLLPEVGVEDNGNIIFTLERYLKA